MPDNVSGAFVELRASTDKLKGDLRNAAGMVGKALPGIAGRFGGGRGLAAFGLGGLAGGATGAIGGVLAIQALTDALDRADPGRGALNDAISKLGDLRRSITGLNIGGNLAFRTIFAGLRGINKLMGVVNRGLETFTEGLRQAVPGASFLFPKINIPQSGSFGTATGQFKFNTNQQLAQGRKGIGSLTGRSTEEDVRQIRESVTSLADFFRAMFDPASAATGGVPR